ncbi:hypothetical protein JTB14_015935 [Gonioctena quinquepunctata]|nr:hypothetical protein JTB14_015935 [Gonioctena quinquepunctata]
MSTTEVRRSKRANKGIPPSRQKLEIQKKLIQKELEVRQAELEESQDLGSTESRESLLLVEELNLGGKETEVLNMDLEKIRIQQWINNIPSVHTFADKSISFSSRSGKAESFEVVKEVPEVEGMYSVKMSKRSASENRPNYSFWPEGEYSTFALFDEASTVTLLASMLQIELSYWTSGPLKIRWTNSITNEEIDSRRVSLGIEEK